MSINRLFPVFFFFLFSFSLTANPLMGGPAEEPLPQAPRKERLTIQQLADWQGDLRQNISLFFNDLEGDNRRKALLLILGVSFLYGVIHAAGPGHRKTIIFSLFIARKSRWWEPAAAGFFSAFLHGFSGLVLITILHSLSRTMLNTRMNKVSIYMEGITYSLLVLIALIFMILKILEITGVKTHSHSHKEDTRGIYSTLAAGSLFPCPGAVMILMFSLAVNQFFTGVMAILSLSLGMGVLISGVAYLAYSGRKGLFMLIKSRESLVEKIGNWLEAGAYLFLMLYSLWAVLPFILSL